jgi:selenoprotein W-related protein
LKAALLKNYPEIIEDITLLESSGGAYEIRVDGDLIYSKLETGRHADPPEIIGLFEKHLKENS